MYFAMNTPNFGDYSDPCLLAELAKEAEDVGWDGFFLWDHTGVVPLVEDRPLSPAEIRHLVSCIQTDRGDGQPFDVAFGFPGLEEEQLSALLPAYAEAGVTWWLECIGWDHDLAEVRQCIRQGPPSF